MELSSRITRGIVVDSIIIYLHKYELETSM